MGVRENAFIAKMGSCHNALLLQKELTLKFTFLRLYFEHFQTIFKSQPQMYPDSDCKSNKMIEEKIGKKYLRTA